MKLLVLTNNPDRPSFRQRFKIYLDDLHEAGIACSIVRVPRGWAKRLAVLRSAGAFDAVYLHKKRLNLLEDLCLRRHCRRMIYDFDDAVMYKDSRPEHCSWTRHFDFRRTVRRADVVIAGNEVLAGHARRYNDNVVVLPTGLRIDDYLPREDHAGADGTVRLGWIGSASTLGYLAGIAGALEEIGRRHPQAVLRIIADRFLELRNMRVEKCVWSLQRQAADLAACHIGLAPLPDNRFTGGKCGFKILQYMATGIPFVASGVGVNRTFAQDSGAGFQACGQEEWIARLSALIEDESLRAEMGRRGRNYVEQYDAKVMGRRLTAVLKDAIEPEKTR
ncbi:MAG TPA: glycosyltransferase family 4 protein [Anaerohalosphaeraceae bacterium]|mgnify:CR=1 FL=1|jgi:glycosyltransferase involved in cell wall biosynthesis|nr:glycosyltransferase family 4 protein [Anaerohalosphaeraceae bacterium]HRT50831.1 glycosyltransferase family 4 protein [Anaerohalosphaeraceae bacterium]HRT86731.1 glycosyltransferase family 4 protein [Anaerohalosphaeraceae bacterium]